MEVYDPLPSISRSVPQGVPSNGEVDIAEMDIDMDGDLDPIEVSNEMQLESFEQPSMTIQAQNHGDQSWKTTYAEDAVPNKVHLRGLDNLTTQDIKSYCLYHLPTWMERVEWIDDTSANIVFSEAATASAALAVLTVESSDLPTSLSPTDLRPAKPLHERPSSNLLARVALTTDRKRPRAHETSRFYLMHPEHDPREQRKIKRERTRSARGYRRRRYSDDEDRRRKKNDILDGFHATMYDDDGPSTRPKGGSSPSGRYQRQTDSYRPVRNRSASPVDYKDPSQGRHRRRSPRSARRGYTDDAISQVNRDKELLPNRAQASEHRELFSDKMLAAKSKKELFPHKQQVSSHRRTDAIDATDETADLFASKFTVPFMDGSNDPKSLADRITRPSIDGERIGLPASIGTNDKGFNIRGASSQEIAIKGGASNIGTIKELFPSKANAQKELFAEKLEGRGRQRMRAEDLFA